MNQENPPPATDLQTESNWLQSSIARIVKFIDKQEELQRTSEEKGFVHFHLPNRPMISKEETAAVLCVSPRHLQRIRRKLGLKWRKIGRETHYYLKELVEAIQNHQCPWNVTAYEKAVRRITRLPRY